MIVIDFKSGSPHPCSELQVAAYCELVKCGIDMDGKKFWDRKNKTAFEVSLYHPIYQYAGTIDCVIDDGKSSIEALILYLKDNGKYSLETIKDLRRNLEIFLCFLRTEKFKREHNLCQQESI